MKFLLLIPAIVILAACGGGGGSDSPASGSNNSGQATPPEANTPPTTKAPESDGEPEQTADLSSDEEFDFIGKNNLKLSLNNNADALRVYLNVCNNFSTVNGEVRVDYSTCQLRTSLPGGPVEYQLTIGGDVERLVAQVWVVEDGAVPMNFYWSGDQDDETWSIVID